MRPPVRNSLIFLFSSFLGIQIQPQLYPSFTVRTHGPGVLTQPAAALRGPHLHPIGDQASDRSDGAVVEGDTERPVPMRTGTSLTGGFEHRPGPNFLGAVPQLRCYLPNPLSSPFLHRCQTSTELWRVASLSLAPSSLSFTTVSPRKSLTHLITSWCALLRQPRDEGFPFFPVQWPQDLSFTDRLDLLYLPSLWFFPLSQHVRSKAPLEK